MLSHMSSQDMPHPPNPVSLIRTETWWMCRPNRVAWLAAAVVLAYLLLLAPFVGMVGLVVLVPTLAALLVTAGRPRVTLTAGELVVSNVFRTHRVPLSGIGSVDTAAGGVCVRTLDGTTVTGFALRHANLLGRRSMEAKWTGCATAIRLAAYQATTPPPAP
jgi:hypothetical protein